MEDLGFLHRLLESRSPTGFEMPGQSSAVTTTVAEISRNFTD